MLSPQNLFAASLQVLCIAGAAGAIAALVRVSAAGVRYTFWRVVLLLCLAWPWLQTPQPVGSVIVGMAGTATVTSDLSSTPAQTVTPTDWAFWLALVLVSGIIVRGTWIAVGCLRLKRLRETGDPAPSSEHEPLQSTLRTRAAVRYVGAVQQPVTFGLRRPVVLLPASLRQRAAATRHAVIAHELVHVARRDWCWVLLEEATRAVFWFHPAIWWLIARVQNAREEVVDSTVVAITGRRREYLEALLAFADDVPLAPAPAFVRRRQLFRRIMRLSTEEVMSARRIIASAVVMVSVVAAASWAAVWAFPLQAGTGSLLQQPGPVEQAARPASPENPVPAVIHQELPALPANTSNDRGTITVVLQTVLDATGSVAELRLAGVSFQLRGLSATFWGGLDTREQLEQFFEKSTFRPAPGAAVERASELRPILEAHIDSAASAVQRTRYEAPGQGPIWFQTLVQFTVGETPRVAVARAAAFSNRSTTLAEGAIRVGGHIKAPTKIKDVKPVYPQEAMDEKVQGVVILEVRIEPDGGVSDAQVLRSIPMLDAAALDAVLQWQFIPTLLNGQAVPVVMVVTIQFSLAAER
jgi:TonB family protein